MGRTFRIVETLGVGAFGAVHLAEIDAGEGLVQRLAVKWLHPQWSNDGELLGRLRDEARLLALLNHDHVVHVHGLTRMGGRLAILMEAIEGIDLSRLEGTPVPARAAIEIVERIADALDAAWNTANPATNTPLRVVHRDIKPSNVMITARGGVKVMDFGVARATFDSREAQTRGQQYGTARYMAPERWLHGVADAPSDVFSLAITAIELLSGAAVERPRLSPEGFVEDIELACARMQVSPGILTLIRRMTAFDPKDRPTAAEVHEACRALAPLEPEPGLRSWAATTVPPLRTSRAADPHDGAVVVEDVSAETFDTAAALGEPTAATPIPTRTDSNRFPKPIEPRRRRWWEIAASSTLGFGLALLLFVGLVWLFGSYNGSNIPEASPASSAVTEAAPPNSAGWLAEAQRLEVPPVPAPTVDPEAKAVSVDPSAETRPGTKLDPKPKPKPKADPPEVVVAPAEPPDMLKLEIEKGLVVTDGSRQFESRILYPFPQGQILQLTVGDGERTLHTCQVDPSVKRPVKVTRAGCAQ